MIYSCLCALVLLHVACGNDFLPKKIHAPALEEDVTSEAVADGRDLADNCNGRKTIFMCDQYYKASKADCENWIQQDGEYCGYCTASFPWGNSICATKETANRWRTGSAPNIQCTFPSCGTSRPSPTPTMRPTYFTNREVTEWCHKLTTEEDCEAHTQSNTKTTQAGPCAWCTKKGTVGSTGWPKWQNYCAVKSTALIWNRSYKNYLSCEIPPDETRYPTSTPTRVGGPPGGGTPTPPAPTPTSPSTPGTPKPTPSAPDGGRGTNWPTSSPTAPTPYGGGTAKPTPSAPDGRRGTNWPTSSPTAPTYDDGGTAKPTPSAPDGGRGTNWPTSAPTGGGDGSFKPTKVSVLSEGDDDPLSDDENSRIIGSVISCLLFCCCCIVGLCFLYYRRKKKADDEDITVVVLDEDGKPRRESACPDLSVYPPLSDSERMTENPLHSPMAGGAAAAGATPFMIAAVAGCTDAITACTSFRGQRVPFATGGRDGGVSVWDTEQHKVIWFTQPGKDDGKRGNRGSRSNSRQDYGHSKTVCSLTQHPEGHSFFSCGKDFTIREWPVYPEDGHKDGEALRTPPLRVWRAPSMVNSISHSHRGPMMVTGGTALLTWNTDSPKEGPVAEFLPNNDREKNVMILSVAFSPFHNDLVCFCTNDGRLSLFNVSSQAVVAHYESPPQAPAFTSLAWHPVISHRVMAGCEDGRVYYFDTSSSIIAVLPNGVFAGESGGAVVEVAVDPTGTTLACANSGGATLLFDIQRPTEIVATFHTKAQKSVYCVGWSQLEQGQGDRYEDLQVMSGSSDRNLRFWDPAAGK